MKTKLKEELFKLRHVRTNKFCQSAYQQITKDWYFNNVPFILDELWRNPEVLSFESLRNLYSKSNVESMSEEELKHLIELEKYLLVQLEELFSKLNKGGKSYGKN